MTRAGRAPALAAWSVLGWWQTLWGGGEEWGRQAGLLPAVSRLAACMLCLGCGNVRRSPAAGCCAGTPACRHQAAQGGETQGREALLQLVSTAISKAGLGLSENLGSCLNAASQSACAGNPAPAGPADQREDNPRFRKEEDRSEVAVGPIWVRQ